MSKIEKYSLYEFEIYVSNKDEVYEQWSYMIYVKPFESCDLDHIDSDEWFGTEQEARFAAIGHINLLENGEG